MSAATAPRPDDARTVHALIERGAAAHPDTPYALEADGDVIITYAEIAQACRAVAALLQAHGVRRGDTVSIVMPNGLNTLRLLLGAMWAGCTVNPVNLLGIGEAMRYVLAHSDCRAVLVAPEWEHRVRALIEGLGRPVSVIVADPDGSSGLEHLASVDAAPAIPTQPEDAALLMYTSGTTGVPKGVVLTNANLASNAHAISREHGLVEQDRVLAVLPLFHINAFAVTMLAPLAHGGSVVMTPKFSAARFWDQAERGGCTWINVVPTIISYLLEGITPTRESLARIRFCRSASAALPPEHHRAFEHAFGIGIIETMGLTETTAPAFSNPLDPTRRKVGSVGRASGCEAGIIDAALRPVADGTTGELAIRGPNVMRGYYKNEAATEATFTPDGWLRTGDLGHRDGDGFFYVTGRIKELIIKGGENIAPREIDEALLTHHAVLEAAAVGIPDRHYGQEILACVVLREGSACDETMLREHCNMLLGRYKTPKEFRFVDALPRGPSGKVQRLKLLQEPVEGKP